MKLLIALVLAFSLRATSVLSISPADVTVSGGSVVDFTIAVSGTPGLVNCVTQPTGAFVGSLKILSATTRKTVYEYTAENPVPYNRQAGVLCQGAKGGVVLAQVDQVAIGVTISPSTGTLTTDQSLQFTTTVTGSSNTVTTWSMIPSVGTLTSAGLYTAPSSISVNQGVLITATSVADPTKSATAAIAVTPSHSVSLKWTASVSTVASYNVYRGSTSGGPYALLLTGITGLMAIDTSVQAGQAYYYVATAVNSNGDESVYSTEASATVPTP